MDNKPISNPRLCQFACSPDKSLQKLPAEQKWKPATMSQDRKSSAGEVVQGELNQRHTDIKQDILFGQQKLYLFWGENIFKTIISGVTF